MYTNYFFAHRHFNNCELQIFKNVWDLENRRNIKRLIIPEYLIIRFPKNDRIVCVLVFYYIDLSYTILYNITCSTFQPVMNTRTRIVTKHSQTF